MKGNRLFYKYATITKDTWQIQLISKCHEKFLPSNFHQLGQKHWKEVKEQVKKISHHVPHHTRKSGI